MEIRGDTVTSLNPERRGPTLGLALTDSSATIWEFTLEAGVGSSFAVVGRFRNVAPTPGSGATRWIGWAHAPGALSWRITYRVIVGAPSATADLALDVSCQAIPVGLQPNNAFAVVVP